MSKKISNMNYFILIIIFLNAVRLFGQTPANDPHWQLVWQDDFNTFDNSRWVKAHYCDHGGEPQLFLENNVWTSSGNLVVRINKTPINCPQSPPQPTSWACGSCTPGVHQYTSGWVETKYPYNTQFGYIEARIKVPYGYGFWPAFWTWRGDGVPTSNESEIDIVEILGGSPVLSSLFNTPYIMTTNLHTEYPDIVNKYKEIIPTGFNYTQWHTYGVEWSPSKIIWYIDGIPARISPNPGIIDPVRIILGIGIMPDVLPNQSTPFPSDMLIDFVKVYRLKNDCNTVLNVCNYNFGTHDNRVKKSITIGNSNCNNSLNNGDNIYLRASEGVLINGDFTVPIGSELYIDVNPCY